MDVFQALVLGIVQGLTEFLPISSSGHLRIVPALLGWEDPGAAFTAVIQIGTLAAVLAYFRQDIVRIGRAFLLKPRRPVSTIVARTLPREPAGRQRRLNPAAAIRFRKISSSRLVRRWLEESQGIQDNQQRHAY